MRWSRRAVLKAGAAGLVAGAGAGVSRSASAAVSGADLKFIFISVSGGWDLTKMYAPLFSNPLIDMEPDATTGAVGGLRFVDSASRPAIRTFLERWQDRTVLFNGISVPSLGHEECMRLYRTGDTSGLSADWPALLAAGSDRYPLPCVVVRGHSFPGTHGALITRIGTTGFTADLLSGELMARSDVKAPLPSAPIQARLDAFLLEQAELRREQSRGGRHDMLLSRFPVAAERAQLLESMRDQLRWPADDSLQSQLDLAIDLLALNASRSIIVQPWDLEDWDTHANSEEQQSWLQQDIFSRLLTLMDTLAATPGTVGATLADETVVVLGAEMGRTPQINAGLGRDHWGVTAAMLCGPRVAGGRTVGGYTDYFYASPIDFASGEVHDGGEVVRGIDFGATLLALADMDPGDWTRDGVPVTGAIQA